MVTIEFESRIVSAAALQPFLQDSGLEYTVDQFTESHRGTVESVLHFVTENKEAILLFMSLFKAFNWYIDYQKLQLEKAKDAREAAKHQLDLELQRLELLEKKATLRVSLKNGDMLILPNETEKEIIRQLEIEAPDLKPIQIKQIELK